MAAAAPQMLRPQPWPDGAPGPGPSAEAPEALVAPPQTEPGTKPMGIDETRKTGQEYCEGDVLRRACSGPCTIQSGTLFFSWALEHTQFTQGQVPTGGLGWIWPIDEGPHFSGGLSRKF